MDNTLLGKKKHNRSDDENSEYENESKPSKIKKITNEDQAKSVIQEADLKDERKITKPKENNTTEKDNNKDKDINTHKLIESNNDKTKEVETNFSFSAKEGLFSLKPTNTLFSWGTFENNDNKGFSAFSNTQSDDFFRQNEAKTNLNKTIEDKKKDKKGVKENDGNDDNNNVTDDLFTSNPQSPRLPNKNDSPAIITQDTSSIFDKLFSKSIDNLYLFSKEDNKFVSKGKGVLSIEKSKKEQETKSAVIVFRNQMGTKIVEGYFYNRFSKFESYVKNFNKVASIVFLQMNKDNKLELKNVKIPFKLESDFHELESSFNEALNHLSNEKKEESKSTHNKE